MGESGSGSVCGSVCWLSWEEWGGSSGVSRGWDWEGVGVGVRARGAAPAPARRIKHSPGARRDSRAGRSASGSGSGSGNGSGGEEWEQEVVASVGVEGGGSRWSGYEGVYVGVNVRVCVGVDVGA